MPIGSPASPVYALKIDRGGKIGGKSVARTSREELAGWMAGLVG